MTLNAFGRIRFNIERGEVDGVEVGGLKVVAVADSPKVMTDGGWRLVVVIDEAATGEQTEKLGGVFSGALGGPMEAAAALVGEDVGLERAAIEITETAQDPCHSRGEHDRLRDRGHRLVRLRGRSPGAAGRHLPSGRLNAQRRACDRLEDRRLGITYTGKSGFSTSEFAWST